MEMECLKKEMLMAWAGKKPQKPFRCASTRYLLKNSFQKRFLQRIWVKNAKSMSLHNFSNRHGGKGARRDTAMCLTWFPKRQTTASFAYCKSVNSISKLNWNVSKRTASVLTRPTCILWRRIRNTETNLVIYSRQHSSSIRV